MKEGGKKMFKNIKLLFLLLISLVIPGCFDNQFINNVPSKNIELKRYLGVWYEIARIPNWFEKGLIGVTATYSLKKDGNIEVLNQGYINSFEGEHKKAIGNAWVAEKERTGRLKVTFFYPFTADYIVIDIDDNYQYALVGSGENFLWILSRTPKLNPEIYNRLVSQAQKLGFETSKLVKVQQK